MTLTEMSRPALTDRQITRMAARSALFVRRGWSDQKADQWADRLHDRDMEQDERHICQECKSLKSGFACAKRQPVLADVLQRCPSFEFWTPTK